MSFNIIGAGGFGKVYLTPKGTVIKGIYTATDCKDAGIEFRKQEKAYKALQSAKEKLTGIEFIDYIIDLMTISQPVKSDDKVSVINGSQFQCSFEMTRLRGLPLALYKAADENIMNNISNDFDPNFEIMLHLSTNTDIGGRFYGIKYSKAIISKNNPPRGYFIGSNDNVLKYLRRNYGFDLNMENIKEIIGFIYGFLYFKARLIPIDVEITLGITRDGFVINVLDFGMCIDLDNIDYNVKDMKVDRLVNALRENKDDIEDIIREEIEDIIREEIGLDLYCDLEMDKYCVNGWNIAKDLYQSS